MRKTAVLGAALAFIGAAAAANAETITAMVQSIDAATQTIVLDDGRTLTLQPGLPIAGLQEGSMVTLNVEQVGGAEVVTHISVN